MKRSPFHRPKQVLVFNGAYVLTIIARSIRSAAEHGKVSPQSISQACSGKHICCGIFYYRLVDSNIEIEPSDVGTLKIQEYDTMCKSERKYLSTREMARKRREIENKRRSNKNNDNHGNEK